MSLNNATGRAIRVSRHKARPSDPQTAFGEVVERSLTFFNILFYENENVHLLLFLGKISSSSPRVKLLGLEHHACTTTLRCSAP